MNKAFLLHILWHFRFRNYIQQHFLAQNPVNLWSYNAKPAFYQTFTITEKQKLH
nr:hypothetical protein [Elizabethkingia sp. ASV34]